MATTEVSTAIAPRIAGKFQPLPIRGLVTYNFSGGKFDVGQVVSQTTNGAEICTLAGLSPEGVWSEPIVVLNCNIVGPTTMQEYDVAVRAWEALNGATFPFGNIVSHPEGKRSFLFIVSD